MPKEQLSTNGPTEGDGKKEVSTRKSKPVRHTSKKKFKSISMEELAKNYGLGKKIQVPDSGSIETDGDPKKVIKKIEKNIIPQTTSHYEVKGEGLAQTPKNYTDKIKELQKLITDLVEKKETLKTYTEKSECEKKVKNLKEEQLMVWKLFRVAYPELTKDIPQKKILPTEAESMHQNSPEFLSKYTNIPGRGFVSNELLEKETRMQNNPVVIPPYVSNPQKSTGIIPNTKNEPSPTTQETTTKENLDKTILEEIAQKFIDKKELSSSDRIILEKSYSEITKIIDTKVSKDTKKQIKKSNTKKIKLEKEETISEEEYGNFINSGTISEDILSKIAQRIIANQEMSAREVSIYGGHKQKIEDSIKKIYNTVPKTETDLLTKIAKKILDKEPLSEEEAAIFNGKIKIGGKEEEDIGSKKNEIMVIIKELRKEADTLAAEELRKSIVAEHTLEPINEETLRLYKIAQKIVHKEKLSEEEADIFNGKIKIGGKKEEDIESKKKYNNGDH